MLSDKLGQFFIKAWYITITKKIVPAYETFILRSINILEISLFFSENL